MNVILFSFPAPLNDQWRSVRVPFSSRRRGEAARPLGKHEVQLFGLALAGACRGAVADLIGHQFPAFELYILYCFFQALNLSSRALTVSKAG